jgi:hypothetical protein
MAAIKMTLQATQALCCEVSARIEERVKDGACAENWQKYQLEQAAAMLGQT